MEWSGLKEAIRKALDDNLEAKKCLEDIKKKRCLEMQDTEELGPDNQYDE